MLHEAVVKKAEGLTNRAFSFALFIGISLSVLLQFPNKHSGDKKTIFFAAENDKTKNEWIEGIKVC